MSNETKKTTTQKKGPTITPRKKERRQKQDEPCGFRVRPITEEEIAELGDAYHGF